MNHDAWDCVKSEMLSTFVNFTLLSVWIRSEYLVEWFHGQQARFNYYDANSIKLSIP